MLPKNGEVCFFTLVGVIKINLFKQKRTKLYHSHPVSMGGTIAWQVKGANEASLVGEDLGRLFQTFLTGQAFVGPMAIVF